MDSAKCQALIGAKDLQIAVLRREIESQANAAKVLRRTADGSMAEVGRLKAQIETHHAAIVDLNRRLAEGEGARVVLRKELDGREQTISGLRKDLAAQAEAAFALPLLLNMQTASSRFARGFASTSTTPLLLTRLHCLHRGS